MKQPALRASYLFLWLVITDEQAEGYIEVLNISDGEQTAHV